jgi:hypothetical protein
MLDQIFTRRLPHVPKPSPFHAILPCVEHALNASPRRISMTALLLLFAIQVLIVVGGIALFSALGAGPAGCGGA